jgi:hypothetical protein
MTRPRSLTQHLLVRCAVAALAACAWLALCAATDAAPPRRAQARARRHVAAPAKPVAQRAAPVAAPGMLVGIDPETGLLGMPSPEQVLQLSPSEKTGLLHTDAGLTPVRLPDGTLKLDLQGRYMEYSVVRLDAQGRPRSGCIDDVRALARWLGTGESAPVPVLEEK